MSGCDAQAAERKNYPVGAIVFGAPLARGRAGASLGDYDLRVIVVAPTNSADDYRLGYLPAGGTEQLVEATVGQRGFGDTFMVVLAPGQQLPSSSPGTHRSSSCTGARPTPGGMRSPRCVQLWHAAPLRATSHELRRGARRRTSDNVFYKEAFHTSDLEQPGARSCCSHSQCD